MNLKSVDTFDVAEPRFQNLDKKRRSVSTLSPSAVLGTLSSSKGVPRTSGRGVEWVDLIVDKYQEKRTALISILHDVQDRYKYLPDDALKLVASRLHMDINEIYGVATFYKSFTLVPQGKHSITVCLGTACHVRGGPKMLRELKALLHIEPGQTTADRQFSLNVVNCLGVCAIGPVMMVDGKFYGEMNPLRAKRIIGKLNNKRSGVKS